MRAAINGGLQAHFLTDGEHDALRWLDSNDEPGGVLAPAYSGTVVPAWTGPRDVDRRRIVDAGLRGARLASEGLFSGIVDPILAEKIVRDSGARFILSDCHGRADISQLVAGFTDPPRRFGCATVWRVR